MKRKERCVAVIGDNNILHHGLFSLIDTECMKRHLTVLSCENSRYFRFHMAGRYSGCFNLAVMCLGYDDFFPCWFSTFLRLLRKTNGNLLVFTDSHLLLNRRRRYMLDRVCEMEYILDITSPVSYISFVLEHHLSRKHSLREICKLSLRELAVIDGFLNGVNAAEHSSRMGIETRTLYQHRKNCANKLGIRNLKDLLRL